MGHINDSLSKPTQSQCKWTIIVELLTLFGISIVIILGILLYIQWAQKLYSWRDEDIQEMCNANYFEATGDTQYFLGHIGWTIIFSALK